MAEEKKGPGPMEDVVFFLGFVLLLVVFWVASGHNKKADIKGIFIHPPAPVGAGGSYGPDVVATSTLTQGTH